MESNSVGNSLPLTLRQQAERKYIKLSLLFTAGLVAGIAYAALSVLFPILIPGLPTVYGLMATSGAALLYQLANLRALKRDFPSS